MSRKTEDAPALLWPTPQARRHACDTFCDHIAAGYSIDSFPAADRKTLRYFAERFPEDFPAGKLEEAARRGLLEWERIGKDGVRGELPKFNATAWSFTMKNRAGWRDRSEVETFSVLAGPGDAAELEALRPRSPEAIALAVMALISSEDVPVHDADPGDAGCSHKGHGSAETGRPPEKP
ncbi:MAG: hypothetical protein Tsb0019_10150 [Roseibium sp.]